MVLARHKALCIDANDVDQMEVFWGKALGLDRRRLDDGDSCLHARSMEEYEAPGATTVSAPGEFGWSILADPEGNAFGVFDT